MSSIARCSNSSATGRSPFFRALPMAPSYSSELPIAFSKIDGFEVTPLTPSVSISCFRSPLATKPRARKSSQTAWPWFSSALTGFMMPCSVRAGFLGSRHLFWRGGGLSTSRWATLRRGICVSPGDNAIHNRSIPGSTCRSRGTGYSRDRRDFVTAARRRDPGRRYRCPATARSAPRREWRNGSKEAILCAGERPGSGNSPAKWLAGLRSQ